MNSSLPSKDNLRKMYDGSLRDKQRAVKDSADFTSKLKSKKLSRWFAVMDLLASYGFVPLPTKNETDPICVFSGVKSRSARAGKHWLIDEGWWIPFPIRVSRMTWFYVFEQGEDRPTIERMIREVLQKAQSIRPRQSQNSISIEMTEAEAPTTGAEMMEAEEVSATVISNVDEMTEADESICPLTKDTSYEPRRGSLLISTNGSPYLNKVTGTTEDEDSASNQLPSSKQSSSPDTNSTGSTAGLLTQPADKVTFPKEIEMRNLDGYTVIENEDEWFSLQNEGKCCWGVVGTQCFGYDSADDLAKEWSSPRFKKQSAQFVTFTTKAQNRRYLIAPSLLKAVRKSRNDNSPLPSKECLSQTSSTESPARENASVASSPVQERVTYPTYDSSLGSSRDRVSNAVCTSQQSSNAHSEQALPNGWDDEEFSPALTGSWISETYNRRRRF